MSHMAVAVQGSSSSAWWQYKAAPRLWHLVQPCMYCMTLQYSADTTPAWMDAYNTLLQHPCSTFDAACSSTTDATICQAQALWWLPGKQHPRSVHQFVANFDHQFYLWSCVIRCCAPLMGKGRYVPTATVGAHCTAKAATLTPVVHVCRHQTHLLHAVQTAQNGTSSV